MRLGLLLVLGGVIGSVALSPALAADKRDTRAATSRSAAPVADAPNARLAAIIDPSGRIIRSKGLANVSNPERGRYCLQPANGTGIDVRNIVPSIGVDWSGSQLNEVMAQYRSEGLGCPRGRIEVLTFDDANRDAFYERSNRVSFTIVVP